MCSSSLTLVPSQVLIFSPVVTREKSHSVAFPPLFSLSHCFFSRHFHTVRPHVQSQACVCALWPLIMRDVSSLRLRKPPHSSLGSELAAELFSFMVRCPVWKKKKNICSGGTTKKGTHLRSEIYTELQMFLTMHGNVPDQSLHSMIKPKLFNQIDYY